MLLVTGITGHTGKYFHETLVSEGYDGPIRCVVRVGSDIGFLEASPLSIELVTGDLRDERFLVTATKDVTQIVHIANIRFTLKLMQAAIANGVERMVAVHTTGVYSKFRMASDEYVQIEEQLSRLVSTHPDMQLTILRPTMIFGDICDRNISHFIRMMDRFRVFPLINKGRGALQPVNARDLGKAYYDVMSMPVEKAKDSYILSGSKVVTMYEMLTMINGFLGKKTLFISCPIWLGVGFATLIKWVTLGRIDYVEKVQRMTEDRTFPHEDASIDFGYEPEAFEVGIEREVKQYLEKPTS